MQETRLWSLGPEDLLEKGMATHFGILAWRTPMNRPWDHKELDSTEQLTLHFMGLKNRISDWEIRKNLESLWLHLLSRYLLHLFLSVFLPTRLLPDSTRLHSMCRSPERRECLTSFLTLLCSLFSLCFSPTVSFKMPRKRTGLAWITYTRINELWRESNVQGRKTAVLWSPTAGGRGIPKEWALTSNPRGQLYESGACLRNSSTHWTFFKAICT